MYLENWRPLASQPASQPFSFRAIFYHPCLRIQPLALVTNAISSGKNLISVTNHCHVPIRQTSFFTSNYFGQTRLADWKTKKFFVFHSNFLKFQATFEKPKETEIEKKKLERKKECRGTYVRSPLAIGYLPFGAHHRRLCSLEMRLSLWECLLKVESKNLTLKLKKYLKINASMPLSDIRKA